MTQWCNVLRTKIVQITPFSDEPTVSEILEGLKSALLQSPSKNFAAAVVKMLASDANASNR